MKDVILRLTSDFKIRLWDHLLGSGRGTEEAAFLFAKGDPNGSGVFRVLDWYPVPPEGFAFCSAYHFELTDETRSHVIKRAHDLGASLVEVHSHDDPEPPAFSSSDLFGFDEFVPHVWWRLKGRPYMAIVVAPGGLDGLTWREGPSAPERIAGVEVGGEILPASHRSPLRWTSDMEGYTHG